MAVVSAEGKRRCLSCCLHHNVMVNLWKSFKSVSATDASSYLAMQQTSVLYGTETSCFSQCRFSRAQERQRCASVAAES
jgi:hypothetical protein